MKDSELEELDFDLLRILNENGRRSHRSIATELDKSHLTIKKLMETLYEYNKWLS